MDGRGRCHDNIFVERLWWTVKHEWVYLRPAANGLEQKRSLARILRLVQPAAPASGARLANTGRGLLRQTRVGRGRGGVTRWRMGRCEFVDSRLRRCPPDRASAVSYGQAGENALRFPHLAHRSAAVHKLHSTAATSRIDFDSGKGETFSRLRALAYSSRNLSKRPGPPQELRHPLLLVPYQRHRLTKSTISL